MQQLRFAAVSAFEVPGLGISTAAGTPSPSVSFVTFLVLIYRGYSLEELDKHISLLHEYNEIKDAGQMLLGKLGKEGKAVQDLFSQCVHTQKEAATMEAKLVLQIPMLFLYFLAVIRGVTTKQLYPEYDLELSD